MKTLLRLIFLTFLLMVSTLVRAQDSPVHWQIKAENPAYGLTLGYSLPKNQLQAIVGDSFTPRVDANGNGNLMLFIATAKKYNLDSTSYNNLKIAHILIPLETSLNNPFIISDGNQQLNKLFHAYNFKVDTGKIELLVEHKGDSIFTKAEILTQEGSICITATFANNPGATKTIPSAKINAPAKPKSFFVGDESYRGIPIPAATIESKGKNWISQLNLPAKPDKIWLNVDFIWDFLFMKE